MKHGCMHPTRMAASWRRMTELGLTVEEVDVITGPAMARPKTGTFALWAALLFGAWGAI